MLPLCEVGWLCSQVSPVSATVGPQGEGGGGCMHDRKLVICLSPRSPILIVATALGTVLWLSFVAWQQNEHNYGLSEAIAYHDSAAVGRLLRAGASPDAPWSGYSGSDFVHRALGRVLLHQAGKDYYSWADNDTILDEAYRRPEDKGLVRLLLAYHRPRR